MSSRPDASARGTVGKGDGADDRGPPDRRDRGWTRDATVVDGEFTRQNGVFVTAENNVVDGIYALDAVDGLCERSDATDSSDAGCYIGHCDPCDAVITDAVAESNGLRYSA